MNLLVFEEQTIIQAAERYVQQELANEASGHDWWHIYQGDTISKNNCRERTSKFIFLCILTALLHDIGDEKNLTKVKRLAY